ncbi:hypothetical protein FRC07_008916, partial [Ceratobasidium sp. 392]
MVSLPALTTIALLIASGVVAAPWSPTTHHHTHRARGVGPTGIQLKSYHPPSVFEGYGVDGIAPPVAKRGTKRATTDDIAKSFLQQKLGVAADALARHSGHSFDGVSYEYFSQIINGIPISNAKANVAIKGDKVMSYGSSFIQPRTAADANPLLTPVEAILKAEKDLGGKYNQWPTKLEYYATDTDHVALVHVVQIQNMHSGEWKQAYVDAKDGNLLNIVDFVADHSYRVVPLEYQDMRDEYEIVNEPADPNASPKLWHESKTYRYGFTEAAYNFQNDNFGKGGQGDDRVQISVQDASGTNNANFATPPDGQTGQMRMFIWTETTPQRDGAMENDIVVHEFTHGVSNRLTGGGTGTCLQTTEAGGMGEGWSDAMADITECKSSPVPDFTLGSYVTNNPAGIRSHPYSTSKTTNPLTYGSLKDKNEVHDMGEVWANMLHNLLADLVEKYGLSNAKDLRDPTKEAGNNIVMRLVMEGFKLQPCNPKFTDARDAIIQADANKYGGAHKCLIWKVFARLGLGT